MQEWLWLSALVWTVVCFAVNAYTWRIAYPLWRSVGEMAFAAVHREYMRRLGPIITLPHVLMFVSSAALLHARPTWFAPGSAVVVFALEASVILVSVIVAGPVHTRFTRNGRMDEPGMSQLMWVSALRTIMMAIATGIMVEALHRQLQTMRP